MRFTKITVFFFLGLVNRVNGLTVDECTAAGWTSSPRTNGKYICFKAFITNSNLTYDEANTICTWNNAVPAPMQNKDDAKAVIESMNQEFHNNHYLFGEMYQIYLGAYHTAAQEGGHAKFYWTIDKTEVDGNYTLWDVGQPDIDSQYISQHEDCLMFRWYSSQAEQSVRWHDVACNCKAENKCYEATGGIICAKIADSGSDSIVTDSKPDTNEKCHDGTQKTAFIVAVDASWETMESSLNHSLPAQLEFVNNFFTSTGECDKLKVIFYAGQIDLDHGRCRSSDFIKSDNLSIEQVFNKLYTREEYYFLNPRDLMKFFRAYEDCTININTKNFYRNAPGFRRIFMFIGRGGRFTDEMGVNTLKDNEHSAVVDRKFRTLKQKEGVQVISIAATDGINIESMRRAATDSNKDVFTVPMFNKYSLNNNLMEDVWERIRQEKA